MSEQQVVVVIEAPCINYVTASQALNLRDGEGHGWAEEFAWLWKDQPQRMADLVHDVAANGIREPILIGTDGRVWDGHHRIAAAVALGLDHIPAIHPPLPRF